MQPYTQDTSLSSATQGYNADNEHRVVKAPKWTADEDAALIEIMKTSVENKWKEVTRFISQKTGKPMR